MQTNGLVYFMSGRGTRQSSPLSTWLFCLATEPVAAAICGATDFPDVTVGGMVHKLMLHADYILLLVSDPGGSAPCLLGIINSFSKFLWLQGELVQVRGTPLNSLLPLHCLPSRRLSCIWVSDFLDN